MHSNKTHLIASSVRKLLRHRADDRVVNLLSRRHPADIANVLGELGERDQIGVFKILLSRDPERAATALGELGVDRGREILMALPAAAGSQLLQELESDDAAVFVAALPEEVAEKLLARMDVEDSTVVQDLLTYEEETAGRIMTPHVFALREDLSVSEAIKAIQTAEELEMVFYLFVVDARGHLVGVTSLRQLLLASPSTPLKKLMTDDVISVSTGTDQEEAARLVALYDLLAIPVVDEVNKLVGMITVDDVIDVIKEEATEDIFYMAGVETDDHIYTPPWASYRKRFPWLILNLATALMAAVVVYIYQPTIADFPILAVFLPIVAGLGGNSGTQTLTVVVRGLALGEVGWENSKKALLKELTVGMANGLSIGLLAGVVAYLWGNDPVLGMVLGLALVINMFVASLVGTLVPLVLKKLNIDPAIASSILLTTFTDVVGFFSFLGLAALLLRQLSPA